MITIRSAAHADLDEMIALWRHLEVAQGPYRIFPVAPGAEEIARRQFADALGDPRARVIVASDGDELVGMAIGWVDDRSGSLDAEPVADLSRVVVAPHRRGDGIGIALVDDIEAWARARGARWLQAHLFSGNEEGRRFWERIGFVPRYEARVRPIPAEPDPAGAAGDVADAQVETAQA